MIRLGLEDYRPSRVEQRAITLADFPQLASILSLPNSVWGSVTEHTALNYSAYWNGVDVLSGQVAMLPRILYRRTEEDERERATGHPAYKVLHDRPNRYMSPMSFWRTLMAHVLTWGNGYAEIEWDNALRPIALWIITPDKIQPLMEGGRLVYRYQGSDTIQAEDILHIPGLGFDGIRGYSVVHMARRSIGLAMASEEFGASFLGSGASASIVMQHPGTLSDAAQKRIRESILAKHGGTAKAGGVMITEEGMKVEQIGIPQKDAQFLESREFQIVEMARWLNMPPHKLKHKVGERPGGNIEASQIDFLTDTLGPWLETIEQECEYKLISPTMRGTFYVEHLVEKLLRMDGMTRASTYRIYKDMGVIDAEYIAKKENLPKPKPKPEPLPPAPEPVDDPPEDDPPEPDAARMAAAQRALVVETAGQFIRAEANEARRASKRGADAFGGWVQEFYQRKAEVLAGSLMPLVEFEMARRGQGGDAATIARGLAAAYATRSKDELLDLRKDDLEGQVDRLVERWKLARPAELADQIAAIAAGGAHV